MEEQTGVVRRRWTAVAVAVALVAAGLAAWLLRPHDEPSLPPPQTHASPEAHGPCAEPPEHPFVPTSLLVAGRESSVRPVARTADGVMGVLPDSDKTEFATDLHGVKAGARHGHVLLNTHTWPDGTALGNRLLARLHVGDPLVLRGEGQVACYRVVRRDQVPASDGYPGWDRRDGRPQVAIVVCSGTRLGPGNWTDRTLWFAEPYLGGNPPA